MRQQYVKKIALLLLLIMAVCSLSGCEKAPAEPTRLSFKAASGYEYLKSISGKPVTINGYMATSSPVDGSFMFLMNLPYQSCPFCVPNTSQLSNTMEVYPKAGDAFGYTAQAIKVTGTLVVAEKENEPFTDRYGYQFNYKAEELSADMALWQKLASSDVISDIYAMYDYVNFLCAWNTYYINSYTDEDGNTIPGYYLYASDAMNFLTMDGAQYNYGYADGYFDGIVRKIEAVDPAAFKDLVDNVRRAEALAQKALAELENGNYTSQLQYIEMFGAEDYVYTLNIGDELMQDMQNIYAEFANWLGSWEM